MVQMYICEESVSVNVGIFEMLKIEETFHFFRKIILRRRF